MKYFLILMLALQGTYKIAQAQNVGVGTTRSDVNLTLMKDMRIDAENEVTAF